MTNPIAEELQDIARLLSEDKIACRTPDVKAIAQLHVIARRLAVEPKADPNPLDPTNHHFRLCLNGHVPYSISFDGCPSCKAVAMNAAQQLNRRAES